MTTQNQELSQKAQEKLKRNQELRGYQTGEFFNPQPGEKHIRSIVAIN
jgi:hypothetical protein